MLYKIVEDMAKSFSLSVWHFCFDIIFIVVIGIILTAGFGSSFSGKQDSDQ